MFNIASHLTSSGIPAETFYLLLSIPFVALIVTFLRYIVGFKTFSIYEPLVIAYALYFISTDFWIGLKFGIPFLLAIWLVGEVFGRIFRKTKLHHFSIIALKLSFASFLVIGVFMTAVYFGNSGFFSINPLPLIIMITMLEAVSVFQVKKGNFEANMLTLQTILVASLSYLLISANWFERTLVSYSFVVIFALVGIYFIGGYSGLKLSEYFRFRNVLKDE